MHLLKSYWLPFCVRLKHFCLWRHLVVATILFKIITEKKSLTFLEIHFFCRELDEKKQNKFTLVWRLETQVQNWHLTQIYALIRSVMRLSDSGFVFSHHVLGSFGGRYLFGKLILIMLLLVCFNFIGQSLKAELSLTCLPFCWAGEAQTASIRLWDCESIHLRVQTNR